MVAAPQAAQQTAALCVQMIGQLRPAEPAQRATVIKALLDLAHSAALDEWPRICARILELVCTLHVEVDAEKIRYAINVTVLHKACRHNLVPTAPPTLRRFAEYSALVLVLAAAAWAAAAAPLLCSCIETARS